MRPFEQFPADRLAAIRFVLTDVDDTLTEGARLPGRRLRRDRAAEPRRISRYPDNRGTRRVVRPDVPDVAGGGGDRRKWRAVLRP